MEVVLPFASDFKNIKDVRNDFDQGTVPFRPPEQLMGVFPESSGKFLPPLLPLLMRNWVRRTELGNPLPHSIAYGFN